MPLNPEDVIRKTFTTSILRRGYDEREVDSFLEEIVAELRRLHGRVGELEGEVGTLQARTSADITSERVQREQHQVELVRAERRDLVADMAQLHTRYEQTSQGAQEAERRRDEAARAAEELEARRAALVQEVQQRQEQLEQLHAEHDEVLAAQDRTAAELRTLRAAADIQADSVGPLDVRSTGNPQLDDLTVVATVAHRLHVDHVEQGRAQGEELRTSAEQEATTLRQSTRRRCEQLLADANDVAQAEHERLVRLGQEAHDRLVGEAEEQRAGVLADLQARRELLETRIESLDRSQQDYRARLRLLVCGQLADLDDEAWSATAAATGDELAIP